MRDTQGEDSSFGTSSARRWVLFCQLANWFNGYALVRPYSSSLEAVIATMVFAQFVSGAKLRPSASG